MHMGRILKNKFHLFTIGIVGIVGLMAAVSPSLLPAKAAATDPSLTEANSWQFQITETAQSWFIKFEGIEGESQDQDHKGWSDIASFSQVIKTSDAPGSAASRRRSAPVLEDIVVVKELDKATPKLAESCLKGQVFSKVEIELTASYTDAGRVVYYKYELKNVQVTSYSISGAAADGTVPMEEFALNFEEIKVTYTEFDDAGRSKGNVEYTWKVEEGES